MFTGIVEEIGRIKQMTKGTRSVRLTIEAEKIFSDLAVGESVSTNGVCLTVVKIEGREFQVDVMNETLERSSLGHFTCGSRVNLERALPVTGRLGGHIVSGHIDGTGYVEAIRRDDIAVWYKIKAPGNLMKYIVDKGAIAIDGTSLTVAGTGRDYFWVSLIPHTLKETVMGEKKIGSVVNLEGDIIGKYVDKLMSCSTDITREFLEENGF